MRMLVALLVALLGAVAGGAIGIGLTYALVSGGDADALTWLAGGIFFCVPGTLGGAIAAGLLARRLFPRAVPSGGSVACGIGASAIAIVLGPPLAIWYAARDTSTRNLVDGRLCVKPGVSYIGTTAERVTVCFTLAPDGTAWTEIGWRFGRGHRCGESATYVDDGNALPRPGRIVEPGFTATIHGASASGVLEDADLCPGRMFEWSARRRT